MVGVTRLKISAQALNEEQPVGQMCHCRSGQTQISPLRACRLATRGQKTDHDAPIVGLQCQLGVGGVRQVHHTNGDDNLRVVNAVKPAPLLESDRQHFQLHRQAVLPEKVNLSQCQNAGCIGPLGYAQIYTMHRAILQHVRPESNHHADWVDVVFPRSMPDLCNEEIMLGCLKFKLSA